MLSVATAKWRIVSTEVFAQNMIFKNIIFLNFG